MKKTIIISLFSLLSGIGFAQKSNTELLVNKVWTIKSDEMSGVGIHTSLTKDTELQFLSDGTWKSSQPIIAVKQGTWRLVNDDRTLIMQIVDEEFKYLILRLSDTELQYRLKKNAATYTYKWVSKE